MEKWPLSPAVVPASVGLVRFYSAATGRGFSSRTGEAAEQVADTIGAAGVEALGRNVDVGESEQVQAMVIAAEEAFGGIDILFTNAVDARLVNTQDRCAIDLDEAVFDEIYQVVMRGVFLSAKYAGRAMIRRSGGTMIFTATTDAPASTPTRRPKAGSSPSPVLSPRVWPDTVSE